MSMTPSRQPLRSAAAAAAKPAPADPAEPLLVVLGGALSRVVVLQAAEIASGAKPLHQ